MKQILFLLACCLSSVMLFSQSEQKAFLDWSDTTGTQTMFYKNVATVYKGEYLFVAGATINSFGNTDILLTKYDSGGGFLWSQQYNGSANSDDMAAGLYVDGSGNAYITGVVSNDAINPVLKDLIVIKYDDSGSQQWEYAYDGGVGGLDAGRDIKVDESNGYVYVTGGSQNSSFNSDIIALCLDGSGNQQWVYTYDYSSSLDDIGYKLILQPHYLTVTGAVTDSPYNYKLKGIKLDPSDGSVIAHGTGTAVTTSSVDVVNDVAIDNQKNIYITGGYDVSGQGTNYYTIKLDSNLVTQWAQTYNGASNGNDFARNLDVDSLGNVFVTGYSTSSTQGRNMVTIKYNSAGTQQWLQTFNNSLNTDDEAFGLVMDDSSNVYITGSSMSDINQKDFYTIKYNGSGTKIWELQTDAHHLNDVALNIGLDDGKNVIVVGQSETSPNVFEYRTEKYIQKDIITPTDFNGETPSNKFRYYSNRGQLITTTNTAVPEIKYYTHNTYPTFYFKENSLSMVFTRMDTVIATTDTLHRIDLKFTNSYEGAKTYPTEEKREGFLNYYLAHIPNGVTGIFGNQKLTTTGLYDNIDLMYSSNANGIKYYFIVKPGGDIRDIKLDFTGASSFSLNGTTNALSINSSIGSITFDRPTVYQLTSANATVAVTGWTPDWQTDGASNKYKFNDGAYTSSLTLVIEVDQGNTNLVATANINPLWCTDYGSPNFDIVYDVDSDISGKLYSTGVTDDHNFPHSSEITTFSGGMHEAFLLRFAPGGTPQWQTIYGGTGIDQGWNVKVDNAHDFVFMTGYTGYAASAPYNTDFPLQNVSGSYNHTSASGSNVPYYGFITKFNTGNGFRTWATLFGADNGSTTHIYGMDVAPNGDLYIGGTALSTTGFPIVTPSTGCTVYSQSINNAEPAFIAKFNLQNQLVWSTHFGIDTCVIFDLRVNSQNELFITGQANQYHASNFPIVQEFTNDYQQTYGGGSTDAFVAKFSDCLELKWSTFVGGANLDAAKSIEISEGSIVPAKTQNTVTYTYISGITKSDSASFPLKYNGNSNAINDSLIGGAQDAFIAGFNSANQKTWTTYVGGSNIDELNDMEFGRAGTLFLTGATKSTDFLNVAYTGAYNQTLLENTAGGNDYDGVVIALDGKTNFTKLWSTYFGGNTSLSGYPSDDYGYAITTSNIYVYIGGLTRSMNNFPWNVDFAAYPGAYYQPNLASGSFSKDGFLAQFDLSLTPLSVNEIKDLDENGFLVYPNPSNGLVYILLDDKKINTDKVDIQVYDIQGREIITKPYSSSLSEAFLLNLSQLTSGMYFIKLVGENLDKSQKIIISH